MGILASKKEQSKSFERWEFFVFFIWLCILKLSDSQALSIGAEF